METNYDALDALPARSKKGLATTAREMGVLRPLCKCCGVKNGPRSNFRHGKGERKKSRRDHLTK